MRRQSIILFSLFYSTFLLCQQQERIIREDRIGNDVVVWEDFGYSRIGAHLIVKGPICQWRQQVPRGMHIDTFNNNISKFVDYISNRQDSLNNVYLGYLSKTTLEQLRHSHAAPLVLHFRLKEAGRIYSLEIGVNKDVQDALNSNEYYNFQELMKTNVNFSIVQDYGLAGWFSFSSPIRKKDIEQYLEALEDEVLDENGSE